ncbi:MAG: Maf family nucleotide pyrophosphatase [Pseudomonadota bacterium]|nr:Maf family nucleotide pyrophosphatase [Pseudomonadota bacterium]
MNDQPTLVLASTSPYRKQLLERLQIPFNCRAPAVDETPHPGESPVDMVRRLSLEKARAAMSEFNNALIIGSDQVAVVDGKSVGKPGGHEQAVLQLQRLSGQTVIYLTGLCLTNTVTGKSTVDLVETTVEFRALRDEQIENYLRKDQPYNCAGSFRNETLGIALCRRIESEDPTALMGLPLIRLCDMLMAESYPLL